MTYAEILAAVKLLSNRGDIDDKIALAIKMVTLRCHRSDFFWRDLIEAKITFTSSQSIVDVDVAQWLYNYRQTSYVRYWDPSTEALGNTLDPIEPRDVLDDFNYEKTDRWYMAGSILKLRFQYPSAGAQVGYYCSPNVSPTAFGSWIAVHFPDIIIQGALAQVYNWTGKQEEARMINQMVGFESDPGRNAGKGPTLLEQLKQFSLEGQAR